MPLILRCWWSILVGVNFGVAATFAAAPPLPEQMGTVLLDAQEAPFPPGPRSIAVHIRYPGAGAKLAGVRPTTGLMLSLHNWGGTAFAGTADPGILAQQYDVVAVGVDYLHSGKESASPESPPYDHGYLQALDALRALHYVFDGLKRRGIAFDDRRIFTTGGSGGGNVSLMANKFAPRTFTAVVDMCGMKRLSDDAAFHLPGGSGLDARYSRDPQSPYYLSPDAQEIRFVGHPGHARTMKQLGCTAKIITVHGPDDASCPFAEAEECAANLRAAGLDYTLVAVTKDRLDGTAFLSTGHALGNRTLIVDRVAGKYLDPKSPEALRRAGPTDFERREVVRYETVGGTWTIDYAAGFPIGRFEPAK